MADVFVRYEEQERQLGERVSGDLAEAGFSTFLAPSIAPGADWSPEVERELTGSKVIVMLDGSSALVIANRENPPGALMPPMQHIDIAPDYDEGVRQIVAELLLLQL